MLRASVFILVLFCLFSCSKKSNSQLIVTPPADSTKSFLALGDSYTIGQSVPSADRFPAQTAALLKQQGKSIAEPVYIAQTGWTTINLQNAIASQNPPASYDIVTVLIGVNDQYQRMDTGGYATRFNQILETAIRLARGMKSRVFVLSIPDYSVTPFVAAADKSRVRMEIDWFNAINKRITLNNGISYTDITPSTREAENNPTLIANDNLHPSGLEYKKWAEMIATKILAVL
jgi:lysophospholipase L1-like esterase